MKKILIAGVTAFAFCGAPALAADMPVKAPPVAPMAAPAYSWTGFYVGASGGADWAHDNAGLSLPPGPPQDFASFLAAGAIPTNYGTSGTGAVYGLQAGYNWQTGGWVWGLEADFSGSTERDTQTQTATGLGATQTSVYSTKVQSIGTVRGRLGAVVSPRLLAYVTGGFAYGQVSHSFSETQAGFPSDSIGSTSNVDTGWTVGGGLEWAVTNNITLRAEYLFVNLSGNNFTTSSINSVCGVANACSFTLNTSNTNIQLLRAGVNYKF